MSAPKVLAVVATLAAAVSLFFAALFVSAFTVPHVFGARDGQGAAGLAALLLLASAAAALVTGVASMVLTLRLRARGWPHAWKYALGAFTLAIVAGAALARA